MRTWIDIATALQSAGAGGAALLLVLKATLILLIARLLVAALPRAAAATNHLIVTIALCAVVALPVLTLALPAWHYVVSKPAPAPERTIGLTGDEEGTGAIDTAVTIARATGVVAEAKISAAERLVNVVRASWQGNLLMVIALISLALVGRMFAGMFGVWLVERSSEEIADDAALRELDAACDRLHLKPNVRLLRSQSISVPVIWGVFRPILLLPAESAQWTNERLRVVLLHELAHLKRLDSVTLLVTRFAVALYWFHPLAWSLEKIGRGECERACDDLVLAGGTKASDYAEHLLQIARALPHFDPFRSVTLAMSRRSQLEGRLLSILGPETRRRVFSPRVVAVAAAAALLILVPLSSFRVVAAPPKTEGKPEIVERVGNTPGSTIDVTASKKESLDLDEMFEGIDDVLKHLDGDHHDHGDHAWYQRGMKLHHADRYEDARAAFLKSIQLGENKEASMYNIACGYALQEDAPNAVAWLHKAMESGWDNYDHMLADSDFDPIRQDAQFQQLIATRVQHEAANERMQEAIDRYRELRAGEKSDGEDWYEAGIDLLRLRQIDESIAAFEEAIKRDENASAAMYNIACAHALRGDREAGMAWLTKAVVHGFDHKEKLQNDPDIARLRSDSRFDAIATMASDLSLSVHKMRNHGDWLSAIWDDEDGKRRWRDALPRFRAAADKYPTIGRAQFNYGYALLQTGDTAGSAAAFKRSLDLGYRPATSAYNIACAYAVANDKDAAFQWLERAQEKGMKLCDRLEDDEDLESLRSDARYARLVRESREREKGE